MVSVECHVHCPILVYIYTVVDWTFAGRLIQEWNKKGHGLCRELSVFVAVEYMLFALWSLCTILDASRRVFDFDEKKIEKNAS